jgi:PAS domain S-box-containing protein
MLKDKINIIFVEDNLDDAKRLWDQLEQENIQMMRKLVGNRNDLIEALNSFSPDLIISGYDLRNISGMEALGIRNEMAPGIPFILVTGIADETIAVNCMKAGADDYIMKRNLHRLGEAVKSAMSKREIIREKDKTESMLRESEEKYRSIVNYSPDAILVHSGGRILFANPTTLRLLKAKSFDQVKDLNLIDFVQKDYKAKAEERFRESHKTKQGGEYMESQYVNLENEVIDVEIISMPITYMGKPAVQAIVRDISERKRVEAELIKAKEKAEESDNLKTAFLHNISHEIRTPMNAIVGFSALVTEPGLASDAVNSYLKIIVDSSEQLLSIVNDIIEISNIEVGIMKANNNDINLNLELISIYQHFNPKAIEKGITFTLHTGIPDNRSVIEADSQKLNQVLSNLLNNAFKFTRSGKIGFGYRVDGKDLEFFVSDTGIGINEAHFNKIFERFYQVESSATRAYEGTGLGLAITKAYVEFMGGRIWLTSQQGRGSTFYFTIPFNVPKYITEMDTSEKNQGMRDNTKSVLIAEDDDNNFFLMKELLSDLNLNIIRASNGVEAVDAFKKGQKIDLVLMDIKMPLMDGYEATKQIREKSPDVAILAQTAYADDEVKAIESGCSGFISKPFVKDRFLYL